MAVRIFTSPSRQTYLDFVAVTSHHPAYTIRPISRCVRIADPTHRVLQEVFDSASPAHDKARSLVIVQRSCQKPVPFIPISDTPFEKDLINLLTGTTIGSTASLLLLFLPPPLQSCPGLRLDSCFRYRYLAGGSCRCRLASQTRHQYFKVRQDMWFSGRSNVGSLFGERWRLSEDRQRSGYMED